MTNNHSPHTDAPLVDVLVVGGGAAGLSAGVVLARSRRDVVLVDAGEQRNLPATGAHNYLTRDGIPPAELAAIGRAELESYGARVVAGRVDAVETLGSEPPRFAVTLGDGEVLHTRRVVLATGVVDELPDVVGLAERWGRDVLHCPYCHGWEVRDQRIGVLMTGPAAMHQVGLFRQLSDDVTLLANGNDLDHGAWESLEARGVRVVAEPVTEVLTDDDVLVGVRTDAGDEVGLDAVVVASVPHAGNPVSRGLGLEEQTMEMMGATVATTLAADPMTGETSVPGVHAVGNASAPMATVVASAASGTQVGAFVNAQLVEEETAEAIDERRLAMREAPAWDDRYGDADSVWSGRVNPQLPVLTADLTPGTVLEVGCGEGGDAIWLARQGWDVTGMDFSAAGLDRAAKHASEAGVEVTWRQGDARTFAPGDERWDLVTAHYVHLPHEPMLDLVRRLASAVAPGGTLLVVGHHPDDVPSGVRPRDDMFHAEDLVPALDADAWDVVAEVADRTGTGVGEHVHVRDTVLLARRR